MSDLIKLGRPGEALGPHQHDVKRLQDELKARGYEASFADIEWAWEQFSYTMDAGWMSLEDSDSNVATVRSYLEEKPN